MHNITIGSPSADEIKALIDAIPNDEKEVFVYSVGKHKYWAAAIGCELGKLGFTIDSLVSFDSMTFKR